MTTPQQTLDRLQATHMPIGRAVLDDCRRHLRRLVALESVIADIREVTALHDAPVKDLPGLIEDIISAMASQNAWLTSRLPAHEVYDEAGQRRDGSTEAGQ